MCVFFKVGAIYERLWGRLVGGRKAEDTIMHSGPPGGGLRFWGKIFRVPFFGSFGFPTCQMIRKKYSNIRGKPFPV